MSDPAGNPPLHPQMRAYVDAANRNAAAGPDLFDSPIEIARSA